MQNFVALSTNARTSVPAPPMRLFPAFSVAAVAQTVEPLQKDNATTPTADGQPREAKAVCSQKQIVPADGIKPPTCLIRRFRRSSSFRAVLGPTTASKIPVAITRFVCKVPTFRQRAAYTAATRRLSYAAPGNLTFYPSFCARSRACTWENSGIADAAITAWARVSPRVFCCSSASRCKVSFALSPS
jgi:hypothetical protein